MKALRPRQTLGSGRLRLFAHGVAASVRQGHEPRPKIELVRCPAEALNSVCWLAKIAL